MFWLDLCLSGLFLWGGVSGYLAGWKTSLRQAAALAATFVTAAFFKGDVKQFISLHYPVEDAIKALIISRIALPVDSVSHLQGAYLELTGLPVVLQSTIAEKAAYSSIPVYGIAELLAVVMLNVLAFTAAAVLWCGVYHLAGAFWPGGQGKSFKSGAHWGGLFVGAARKLCFIIFIIGATAPFLWLPAIPKEIFDPQQAVLVRWALKLFNDTGIWWN